MGGGQHGSEGDIDDGIMAGHRLWKNGVHVLWKNGVHGLWKNGVHGLWEMWDGALE